MQWTQEENGGFLTKSLVVDLLKIANPDEIGGSGLVMVGLEHPAQAPSWSRANELEDSLVGVTSGLAAGMAVLGVPALQPVPPAPGLTLVETLDGADMGFLADVLATGAAVEFAGR